MDHGVLPAHGIDPHRGVPVESGHLVALTCGEGVQPLRGNGRVAVGGLGELRGGLGLGEHLGVGGEREHLREQSALEMVGMLMGHQHRIDLGEQLLAQGAHRLGAEGSRVDQQATAGDLHEQARVDEVADLHRFLPETHGTWLLRTYPRRPLLPRGAVTLALEHGLL